MTTRRGGLREQKKQATNQALRAAALRLALERGPENVRVDDIAEAAGVSPRTYNNYFSSRERAIVAAVTAEREERIAAAVAARAPRGGLADAVTDAIVEQFSAPSEHHRDAQLMIISSAALRDTFVDTVAAIEHPLADVIAQHLDESVGLRASVLAASVAAAVRIALRHWLKPFDASPTSGLVVPSGSLPDLLRTALAPLASALDAAEESTRNRASQ